MKIRLIERRDRQQWDRLWQGYLDFYEATLSQDRTDLTWERFFDSTHVFKAYVAEIDDVIVGIAFNATLPMPRRLRLFHAPAAGTDAVDLALLPAGAALCNCFGHEAAAPCAPGRRRRRPEGTALDLLGGPPHGFAN